MALKELEARYATKRTKDYKLFDGEGLYASNRLAEVPGGEPRRSRRRSPLPQRPGPHVRPASWQRTRVPAPADYRRSNQKIGGRQRAVNIRRLATRPHLTGIAINDEKLLVGRKLTDSFRSNLRIADITTLGLLAETAPMGSARIEALGNGGLPQPVPERYGILRSTKFQLKNSNFKDRSPLAEEYGL